MFARTLTFQTTKKLKKQLFLLERLFSAQSAVAANFDSALHYKSIPRHNILSFIRDFMPGGQFHDVSFYDYALKMRQRLGDIFVMPGMFGKPDMVMVFNTKDFETVYRNEGQWPQRQVFESFKHFREKVRGDFFSQTIGLPLSQGEQWGKMRSAVNPVLMKPQNLTMYIKPLQEITDEFTARIKEIRDPKTFEVPANFDNELNRLTFESISLDHMDDLNVAANFDSALHYKSIPRHNILSFIRDFMPGGQFHDVSFYDYALKMRQRLGDIFVMPGMFGKPDMVMVFNTKDFETVYRNEGQWPQRQVFESFKHFREKVRGDFFSQTIGLPLSQGEQWGKMRSAVNPVLMKPQNLTMYIKPLQEITDEFTARIKEIRDPKTFEVPANFDNELNRLTFESISLVALNRKLGLINKARANPDAEHLIKCTGLMFDLGFKLDIQPSVWQFIRTPLYYQSMKVQEDLFRITQKYVNETLEQIKEKQKRGENNDEIYSVLEKLLVIDEKLALVMAMDMLIVGVDTTSVTLIAILLCLAKNPEKQRILREEIVKVMPTKDTELNENNMKNLPYLRAVIKEAIRYYPNSSGALRCPTQDVVLSGYKIPKGSNVLMNFNCLLKDEDFFPQAERFLPERWLRDENSKKMKLDPFSYLPFGVGPRICVGKRLVELEMEIILLKVLRNFEVEFHYDASKPFKQTFFNLPGIPMLFTFKDIQQ